MAQELDDGEFWLPSEFLTDDDLLMDLKRGYDLSSPAESVTETESDEDDFISGLTRKGWGSNQSSPNSALGVSSSKEIRGWDLLCAAAEQVQMMRITDETAPFCSNKPVVKTPTPASTYYAQTEAYLAFLQLQAPHFQKHHIMKSGVWKMDGEIGRTQGTSMASWPTLQQSQQQQPGPGMRAVFHGETVSKKERTGTGVFLPRTLGSNPAQNWKKPGASLNQRNHNGPFLQQRRSQPAMKQELRLPQEWTY
ncbi:hypothetical protein AAHA92_17313 [Salvia divinorum]|uniref:Uncharacterized protein n=1 Tax=Salvia divinorum TaxID=28513 RepID=A0ABD1GYE1_SALDI